MCYENIVRIRNSVEIHSNIIQDLDCAIAETDGNVVTWRLVPIRMAAAPGPFKYSIGFVDASAAPIVNGLHGTRSDGSRSQ